MPTWFRRCWTTSASGGFCLWCTWCSPSTCQSACRCRLQQVGPFRLTVVHSARPNGFARNHNLAFTHCQEDFFCVVNPDVRFLAAVDDPFPALCRAAMQVGVGLAYPMQVDRHGQPMDHERTYPTPLALLCRYMGRAPARRVDWVNGAFMLVQHTIYRQLGGFNERFHMYCEDVDWCLRLRAAGYTLAAGTGACGA